MEGKAAAVVALLLPAAATAADYYVWGGVGSDRNDGSAMDAQHAWSTLSHADDMVGPGDTVFIKGTFGNTLLDSTTRGNGSSWSAPVTYRVHDESGADFELSAWHGVELRESKRFVILDGSHGSLPALRLYASSTSCGNALQLGGDALRVSGLVINPPDVPHRCGKGMHIGALRPEINTRAEEIEVLDSVLYNGNHGDFRETIYIGTYDAPDRADRVDIHHNDIYNIGTSGQSYETDYQVDIIDIKPCVEGRIAVHDNRLTLLDNAREFAIHGNVDIYDNVIDVSQRTALSKSVFMFHDYRATVNIYRNIVIGGPGQSIALLCCGGHSGRTVSFYSNIFTRFGGSSSYIVSYASSGSSGTFRFFHNTFADCPGLRGIEDSPGVAGIYLFKNNLWSTWGDYALTDGADMSSAWDGNHYHKSGASRSTAAFRWNGRAASFEELQDSGQESAGTFGVDPGLDDSGRLRAPLPAPLDVSPEMAELPDFDRDIDGEVRSAAWDLGADQFAASTCSGQACQPEDAGATVADAAAPIEEPVATVADAGEAAVDTGSVTADLATATEDAGLAAEPSAASSRSGPGSGADGAERPDGEGTRPEDENGMGGGCACGAVGNPGMALRSGPDRRADAQAANGTAAWLCSLTAIGLARRRRALRSRRAPGEPSSGV